MHNDKDTSKDGSRLSAPQPEIDYAPRTHTMREQVVFGLKLAIATGLFFLTLWYFER